MVRGRLQSFILTPCISGKFASNPNVTSKIPTLKDGVVKLVRGEDEEVDPVYTAVGVFITSFARDLTIRAAQTNYDSFAYADTDSLHLIMDSTHLYGMKPSDVRREDIDVGLTIHPTDLGAWKFEYAFDAAFYIRSKAYMEHIPMTRPDCDDPECSDRHDYITRIAGFPVALGAKLTFDDLKGDIELQGKLTRKVVKGGVVLVPIPYELKIT